MIKELDGKAGSLYRSRKQVKKWSFTSPPCSKLFLGFFFFFLLCYSMPDKRYVIDTTFPSLLAHLSSPIWAFQSPDQDLFLSRGLSVLSQNLIWFPHLLKGRPPLFITLKQGNTLNGNHCGLGKRCAETPPFHFPLKSRSYT